MKVTVEVPDSIVEGAVLRAWAAEFHEDGYGRRDGQGYQRLREQVREAAAAVDVTEDVHRMARELLPGIVRDVVADVIRKKVREEARAQVKAGTMFDGTEAEG